MKKLLFFILTLFVVTNVKIMADCSLVSKINEDILGGSVLSAVNSINLKGDIYCDKEGYHMVYYLQNNNYLQVGLEYKVNSLESSVPIGSFISDADKIYGKIKEDLKGRDIIFRMYLRTNKNIYQHGSISINKKGKETHYSNVNNKGTSATGAPFGARRIKYSFAAPNWDYTDDIIY